MIILIIITLVLFLDTILESRKTNKTLDSLIKSSRELEDLLRTMADSENFTIKQSSNDGEWWDDYR